MYGLPLLQLLNRQHMERQQDMKCTKSNNNLVKKSQGSFPALWTFCYSYKNSEGNRNTADRLSNFKPPGSPINSDWWRP